MLLSIVGVIVFYLKFASFSGLAVKQRSTAGEPSRPRSGTGLRHRVLETFVARTAQGSSGEDLGRLLDGTDDADVVAEACRAGRTKITRNPRSKQCFGKSWWVCPF